MVEQASVEIHTSELSAFKHCRRKWALAEIAGLQVKRTSPALFLGSAVHKFMEGYYSSNRDFMAGMRSYEEYVAEHIEEIATKHPDLYPEQEDKLYENIELGRIMLAGYHEHYEHADDFTICKANGKPLVEIDFRTPIIDPDGNETGHFYGGTIDGIKRDEIGIWVAEHKTAKDIVTTHLRKDEQATMYMTFAKKQWPKLRKYLRGVHYNFLRKREPSPRLKTPLFHRERVYRNEYETEQAMSSVYHVLQDMMRVAADPEHLGFIAPSKECNWKCQYQHLCFAMDDGTDVRWLIEVDFEEERSSRNGWPITWLTEE